MSDTGQRLAAVVLRQPGHVPLRLLVGGPALEVGRDCTGVVLSDPKISRRHLALRHKAGRIEVTDLGSMNGTRVDGAPIRGAHVLAPGEVVEFGSSTLELWHGTGPSRTETARVSAIDRIAVDLASVTGDLRAELPSQGGTVTVVFSDVADALQRQLELGDEHWLAVLETHNAIVRRQLDRHRGSEVASDDDGFMLLFENARDAVGCLVDVQRALHAVAQSHPAQRVGARAGVHAGEWIVDDDGDLFERLAFVAARIAAGIHGGEVVVSSIVRELVESRGDIEFGPSRLVSLGGSLPRHRVHPIEWMPAYEHPTQRSGGS